MNRDIKFRAWDATQKKMILNNKPYEGSGSDTRYYFLDFHGQVSLLNLFGLPPDNNPSDTVKDLVLMQFTGLKDKADIEIYEGDLITNTSRNNNKPHKIKWSEKFGAWVGDYGMEYLIGQELVEIKKVGNIYENAELISKVNENI